MALLETFRKAWEGGDLEAYRAVFDVNGKPDPRLRDGFKPGKEKIKIAGADLLFEDDKIAIVRLYTDHEFLDYQPHVLCYDISLITVRKDSGKLWSVCSLDSGKEEAGWGARLGRKP